MINKKTPIHFIDIFSILFLFTFFANCQLIFGKETKVILKSTGNEIVSIYKPIDKYCNYFQTLSNEFKLSPELEICYKPKILDFSFIQISYSDGKRYSLLLHSGDSLQLSYNNGILNFSGDNASGQVYLNTFSRRVNVDSIFDQHLKGGINIAAIRQDIKTLFFDGLNNDIKQLQTSGKISKDFGQKIYNDMNYAVADMYFSCCNMLLRGFRKVKLTQTDSLSINKSLDSFFIALPPYDKNIIKYRYPYKYISRYYSMQYNKLNTTKKIELLSNNSEDTFGPYTSFLLSPDYLQIPLFGSIFLNQINYGFNEFDKSKMYNFINAKFPESEYLKIIQGKYVAQKKEENKTPISLENKISFLTRPIKSLKELSTIPELKGKRIFIDIWATWCVPCRMQFQFKDKLDSLAKKYDIAIVYISIDKEVFRNKWTSDVEQLKLNGNHILANENLQADIQKNIYLNKGILIPRYILLDKNANILNNDAPRPSAPDDIEKLFKN
jgi:thiol-disulfide isomerase/thioredoxin